MNHLAYFNESNTRNDFMDEHHRLNDVRDILLNLRSFMESISELIEKRRFEYYNSEDRHKFLGIVIDVLSYISGETDHYLGDIKFEFHCRGKSQQILNWVNDALSGDELTDRFKFLLMSRINDHSYSRQDTERFLKLWDVLRGVGSSEKVNNIDELEEFIQENIIEDFDIPMKIVNVKAKYIGVDYHSYSGDIMDRFHAPDDNHILILVYCVTLQYRCGNGDQNAELKKVRLHVKEYESLLTDIGFVADGGVFFGTQQDGIRNMNFYLRNNNGTQ
jgi:hypothetical protein